MIRRPPRSTPLPLHDALPIYQASPKTNDTLTVSVTSHDDDGDAVTYSYQWQKDTGSGFANIAGATGSTLNLATAGNGNSGDAIRVDRKSVVEGKSGELGGRRIIKK